MLRKEGQEGGSQAPTHSADSNREQSNNVSWNISGQLSSCSYVQAYVR